MGWLRSNKGRIVWLALFALACQLALSFGHVHPGKNVGSAWAALGAASNADQSAPSAPRGPAGTADDFCAICAVVAMANAALFATPPALPLPQAVEFLYLTTDAGLVHRNPVRVAFQPRAPPAA